MSMPEPDPGALGDLRVIDMASLYAAPLAATIMADFGADVVKVEPPEGDGFRGSKMWPLVARGKRCVALDLRSEEGCAALKDLVARADVVVENYPPGVLDRRGIGWQALSAINPRMVMLSISCFGAAGPYAGRPGSGTIGEGFAGLTHLTGAADGPPTLPTVALGDAVGAMSAVIGVLAALRTPLSAGRPGTRRGGPAANCQACCATSSPPPTGIMSQFRRARRVTRPISSRWRAERRARRRRMPPSPPGSPPSRFICCSTRWCRAASR
jgi:crotonobetainyl-CoA:carnitine CoA-transferase CaiB-like acyl-CoA transferase